MRPWCPSSHWTNIVIPPPLRRCLKVFYKSQGWHLSFLINEFHCLKHRYQEGPSRKLSLVITERSIPVRPLRSEDRLDGLENLRSAEVCSCWPFFILLVVCMMVNVTSNKLRSFNPRNPKFNLFVPLALQCTKNIFTNLGALGVWTANGCTPQRQKRPILYFYISE